MFGVQKVFALPLAAALGLIISLTAAPAPAEAGKIGRAIGKAATKAAIKGTVRSMRKNDRNNLNEEDDQDDEAETARSSVKVDHASRAAEAKAKLDAENQTQAVLTGPATAEPDSQRPGFTCVAGCDDDPVPAPKPKTAELQRPANRTR